MKKILLLLILLSINLYSSDKDSWTVVFSDLNGVDLSLNNQYLVKTIPGYFQENLIKDFNHTLSIEEEEGVNSEFIQTSVDKLLENRLKEIDKREELLFKESTPQDREKIDKKISEIENEIDELKASSEFDLIESLEIDLLERENPPGRTDVEIRRFMLKKSIDYLFTGVLEEDNEILFIDIYLYSKYKSEPELIYSGVGETEDILSYREDIMDKINRRVVQRDLVNYRITVNPGEALIYVNKDFKGLGEYSGYSFIDERVDIELMKEGYDSQTLFKRITEDNRDFAFDLVEKDKKYINISSEPAGASVLFGSKYLGITPIEVPVLSTPQKLSLKLEGYMTSSLTIKPGITDQNIILDSNIVDVDENFAKSKDRFYLSLGVFSISLAVPLFLHSQLDLVSGDGFDTSNLELYKNISIGNAVLWGLNMVYQLYRYLEAAKLSVE